MTKVKILKGHLSPETAYVVADYPYGFRLRCQKRYWLETHLTHGVRLVWQTSNPKRGNVWNKPKASTYCKFGGCMVLDTDTGHVNWTGLTQYCNGAEAKAWSDQWRDGVPPDALNTLDAWVAAKLAYDAARQPGDPLETGIVDAHKAWLDVAIKQFQPGSETNGPE